MVLPGRHLTAGGIFKRLNKPLTKRETRYHPRSQGFLPSHTDWAVSGRYLKEKAPWDRG